MIKMAIYGYGTVGNGVAEVLRTNHAEINKKSGEEIELKYILDLREFPGDIEEDKITHNVDDILEDPEIQIICETMGGLKPAYDYTKRALLKGKSVCTSNKELVATHGPELIRLAKENHCNYLFEASVGGGIPIIRPINYSLTSERIEKIAGILNGTTNYILTKMDKEGADYETCLKEAQALGYAERNPEADVEGYDACRKIAILSSLMYGKNVKYEDIYTEGITKITKEDFIYAHELNMTIKLLAMSKSEGDSCFAMVAPFLVPSDHPLYVVNDVYNGIFVHGNMLGDTMYYGRGAGKLPTASAVISDVVDCARHLGKTVMTFWEDEDVKLTSVENARHQYLVRLSVSVSTEKAMETFGTKKMIRSNELIDEYAIITDEMSEKEFAEKLKECDTISSLRIESR